MTVESVRTKLTETMTGLAIIGGKKCTMCPVLNVWKSVVSIGQSRLV